MGKIQENNRLEFLIDIGVNNKTHINVLSKYKELRIPRTIVFLIAFLTLMTATEAYALIAAVMYIGLEIFLYRYNKNLMKFYSLENSGNDLVLKEEPEKEDINAK